jgi:hypothetical protein
MAALLDAGSAAAILNNAANVAVGGKDMRFISRPPTPIHTPFGGIFHSGRIKSLNRLETAGQRDGRL